MTDLELRAARHAALADVSRLGIVDLLQRGDASPHELQGALGLGSNLLAHHLGVLERAGLVSRRRSEGDRRRSYVHLVPDAMPGGDAAGQVDLPDVGTVLFVCTGNSARSQLAAALWNQQRDAATPPARSAGTHPADRVHPVARVVGERRGLQLADRPVELRPDDLADSLVITVCDAAHEELACADAPSWHWSVPDPVPVGTRAAFATAADDLDARIHRLQPTHQEKPA